MPPGISTFTLKRVTFTDLSEETARVKTLEEFLDEQFASAEKETTVASAQEKAKFGKFMVEYKKYLAVEKLATEL